MKKIKTYLIKALGGFTEDDLKRSNEIAAKNVEYWQSLANRAGADLQTLCESYNSPRGREIRRKLLQFKKKEYGS